MDTKEIIDSLSIKDKIKLLSGKNYWETQEQENVTSIRMSDGPNGLRKQEGKNDLVGLNGSLEATCFPTACLSACSFDPVIIEKMGKAIGSEARSQNVDLLLGPGLNIKRSPLGGRNFEYFSEDPFLSGKMTGAFARGVESMGVGACLKHYACNSQEKERFISNSLVDERTLNELYLKGFEIAIKESNPSAIMTSYNMVNSDYMCENKDLLDKARGYGFKGMFVTDWGGLNNPIKSFKNGLNIEMPGVDKKRARQIYEAYKNGLISEDEINNAIAPLIEFSKRQKPEIIDYDYNISKEVALDVARKSIVLAKNEDCILPLNKDEKIGVIGKFAINPRIQGAGSSAVNPKYAENFVDILTKNKVKFDYNEGFDDNLVLDEAIKIAKENEKAILFLGLPEDYESEGYDKTSLSLPEIQVELVNRLSSVNSNIIVVLESGSPVELPFLDKIKGLFITYLGGSSVLEATYDLMFGNHNPSGRLAETWPKSLKDTVSYKNFPELNRTVHYTEGMYVGYRHYHSKHIDVNFPFGYGLTYSDFSYKDIVYKDKKLTLTVTNNGQKGEDVIQLYLENNGQLAYRRLVDFKKIELDRNESKTICFEINDDLFTMYDVKTKSYIKASGLFTLELGTSSKEIYYKEDIKVEGEKEYIIPSNNNSMINSLGVTKKININSTFSDLESKKLGRLINKFVQKKKVQIMEKDPKNAKLISAMIDEMPLRSLVMGSGGKLNSYKLQGLIDILNGKVFKGIIGLLK